MQVFISYSREDEAIAHLLAYILSNRGIRCLIDRQLQIGRPFEPGLRKMIMDADRVLLLLTQSSVSSPWVNQEIGFAIAHDKPIWPLAMEENIQPIGMLASTQSYSLFDWSDPSRTIEKLATVLQDDLISKEASMHYERLGLDQVITGKVERTEFLIRKGSELFRENSPLQIYLQAAFSPFAISSDPMYKEAGNHSDEYLALLLQERKLLEEAISQTQTRFKMLIWPVRAYDAKYLAIRYKNLLDWMRQVLDRSNIEYACAQYLGSNRFIVAGRFCIAGYKLNTTSGYEMSIVTYDTSKIEGAIREFEYAFDQARANGMTKEKSIEQVETMYRQVSRLSD